MKVAEQMTKPWSYAMNDMSSTSTYNIKIEGYNEAFDHTCNGGGVCIVSNSTSKIQILYTDWGVKYRIWIGSNWGKWIQLESL